MSVEQDAEARLASLLHTHLREGNVLPFRRSKPKPNAGARAAPQPTRARISVSGTGNAVVVGSHNTITIDNHPAPAAGESDMAETSEPIRVGLLRQVEAPADDEDAQARMRHVRYIRDCQQQMHKTDAELAHWLERRLGKSGLQECSAEDLMIVRNELIALWRHTF